jgi:hypothetical protein
VRTAARTVLSLLAATAIVATSGCHRPRLTAIGDGWFVDETPPGKPATRLYREVDGMRVVVDGQIEAYRLYARHCLIYEAPRAEGRFLFVVAGGLTPVAFSASNAPRRWRLDIDGPRRFDTVVDPNRSLLAVEWINFGDPCYLAQTQPPFRDDWARTATYVLDRLKIEESILDVHGEDSVGNSTLSDAAREGQVVLVDELLSAGADPNSANNSGVSVLMTASNPQVVRRVIEGGARVDAQDGRGQTALMYAARYRNLEKAKLLLEAGASRTMRDDSGRTAAAWVPDSDGEAQRQLRTLLAGAAASGQ